MYLATAWGLLVNNPLTNGRLMGIMCISDEALVSFFNISCQSKQQWLFKIVVNAQSKIWVNYNIPDLYRKKTMFMPWQLTARGVDCMFIFGNVDQNMIQQRCSCLLLSVCQFSACEFQHCWLYVSYQHCWLCVSYQHCWLYVSYQHCRLYVSYQHCWLYVNYQHCWLYVSYQHCWL